MSAELSIADHYEIYMDELTRSLLDFPVITERIASKTSTEPGRNRALNLQPLAGKDEILRSLNVISQFQTFLREKEQVPFYGVEDIGGLVKKAHAEGACLTPVEVSHVASVLSAARRMRNFLRKVEQSSPDAYSIHKQLYPVPDLERDIYMAVDSDGNVVDGASPELKKLRKDIYQREEDVRSALQHLLKTYAKNQIVQEEFISIKDGRFVLPIKEEHYSHVKGIVHHRSATGQTLFIEPIEVVELNNAVEYLKAREDREIRRILTEFTDRIREHADDISESWETLGWIDYILAAANLCLTLHAEVPQITEKSFLELKNARHPLLLLKLRDESGVVPLNLHLGESFTTLVITGPNAGGKTVALKTAGLLCLMVQAGLPVPVDPDSSIPVFQEIYCDLGDEQSIAHDISTFSGHMLRAKTIVEEASESDLVLMDEVGTGTDPSQGTAIAMALLEELTNRKCLTIATTHHGQLKAFAHDTPGVENGSMSFDEESLEPTYRLQPGIPGSSYAYEIAQRLQFPGHVLMRARQLGGELRNQLEELIRTLDHRRQEYDSLVDTVSRKEQNVSKLISDYEDKVRALKKTQKQTLRQAAAEAAEIIDDARQLVEQIVADIRSRKADKPSISTAKKHIQEKKTELIRKIDEWTESAEEAVIDVQENDMVYIPKFRTHGRVVGSPDGKRIRVQTASATLEVDRTEIAPSSREKMPQLGSVDHYEEVDLHDELDVRGTDSLEALTVMDRYLEEAVKFGLERVRIIHGIGTGTLRDTIRQALRKHQYVKEFRSGLYNEGKDGVTVITLVAEKS